jgi:hypothetical protein
MTSNIATVSPTPLNVRVAPTTDPLISSGLSGWLGRGWGIVRRSYRPLLALAAAYVLIGAVAGVALSHLAGLLVAPGTGVWEQVQVHPVLTLVLAVVLIATSPASSFLQAASTYVAIRDAAGRPTTSREVTRFAAERALPLAGWWLVAASLVVLGWMFFVVPGIYLAVVLGGALTGVVVVERQSISRCFLLIAGRFWATLGRLSLFGLVAGLYYLAATFVSAALLGAGSDGAMVLTSALTIPLGVAASAFMVATYAELRYHENRSTTTDRLAAELTQ